MQLGQVEIYAKANTWCEVVEMWYYAPPVPLLHLIILERKEDYNKGAEIYEISCFDCRSENKNIIRIITITVFCPKAGLSLQIQ